MAHLCVVLRRVELGKSVALDCMLQVRESLLQLRHISSQSDDPRLHPGVEKISWVLGGKLNFISYRLINLLQYA